MFTDEEVEYQPISGDQIPVLRKYEWLENRCWKGYEPVPGKKPFAKKSCRKIKESNFVQWLEEKEEKPYKGFNKEKNHPEGGLSRSEAKKHGIHAGIETKDEAERKGGFSKLSDETQKRRKSFCARMQGMKKKNTSSKVANDPDSKINASLRVWGC